MIRPFPPDLLSAFPPQLGTSEQIAILQSCFGWTPCQAKVVLAGVEVATYRQIGNRLGIAERTVHAHYSQLYLRHPGESQTTLTARAVAAIWHSLLPAG